MENKPNNLHLYLIYKGQSNLAKGDIRSSIIFARWQHVSRSWSRRVHLDPHFGEGEVVGGDDGTIRNSDGGFLW